MTKWSDYAIMNKIINPWEKVTINNRFAVNDENSPLNIPPKNEQQFLFGTANYTQIINNQQPSPVLTFDCLPSPYSGNPDANVYCLNMNPGQPDKQFDTRPLTINEYTKRALDNLKHNVQDTFWTDGLVKDHLGNITVDNVLFEKLLAGNNTDDAYIHDGARWQRGKTKELRDKLDGRNPNIFFLEFFPYHSKYGFNFPQDLPSYKYRNDLLEFAMNEEKIIIIMRKEKLWNNISDRNIGYRLLRYKKKIILKYVQGGWLTRNNMTQAIHDYRCECLAWNDIISVL